MMESGDRSDPPWADAVTGLAHRVIGPAAESLRFTGLDGSGRRYESAASGGELTIAATDGISASVALHHYLRERCGRSVGWDTPLPLPITGLPDSAIMRRAARVREGYYLNFCTFAYTMAFWDWPEWEREIDWMALHGITMPLALTGHEAAVHRAYSRLGLDDATIRSFLGGPGYLPWQFMGCLGDVAGPLPTSWIERHRELGQRILRRERALGMTPVLPAFTGHIPRELAPSKVTRRTWQGFETWVLDPADPLYERLTDEITRAQIELFGTDHWYAADPFIEMLPAHGDATVARTGEATQAGLRSADPDARWLLQAWPFSYQSAFWTDERIRALLDSVPGDLMLVADLWAEADPQWRRLDGFARKPWLWCGLLNFGGRTDPIADLAGVPESVDTAIDSATPPVGLGLSMEATRVAPVFYELVTDQIWTRVDGIEDWLDDFVAQRYGGEWTGELRAVWRGLLDTIYAARGVRIAPSEFNGIVTRRPSYAGIPDDVESLRSEVAGASWYEPAPLAVAWDRMIRVAEQDDALAAGPLGHDLIEVGIAYAARLADRLYLEAVDHSVRRGRSSPIHLDCFLRLFGDLDRLLATRPEFTMAHWESTALSWAGDPTERELLLDNAHRILTVWGSTDSPLLDDYAGRHWAGLVGGYYRDRWALWADGLDAALASPGAGHEATLQERLRERAEAFLRDGPPLPPADLGDVAMESRRLFSACVRRADGEPDG